MGTRSRLPSTSTRAALAPFRAGVHSRGGTTNALTPGEAAIVYPLASTSVAVASTNTAITNTAIVITVMVVLASSVVTVATTTAVIALAMAATVNTTDIVANTTVTTIT